MIESTQISNVNDVIDSTTEFHCSHYATHSNSCLILGQIETYVCNNWIE